MFFLVALDERGREPLHLRVVERDCRTDFGDLVLAALGRELDEPGHDRGKVVAATGTDDERRDRPRHLQ